VKSVKHHLRRVLGETSLTYEELSTLLAQVEACLNSRPLEALSDDPDDTTALTPGHFLIGTALNAVPEASLAPVPSNRLARWQMLQRMRDHFWERWSQEYIHSLLSRPKWKASTDEIQPGRLCLIRNEHAAHTLASRPDRRSIQETMASSASSPSAQRPPSVPSSRSSSYQAAT